MLKKTIRKTTTPTMSLTVVRVEGNAVERDTLGVEMLLDLDAVRIVRTDFVQRQDVRGDQAEQHERHGDHVEREEAVERRIADHGVAADPDRQQLADEQE